MKPVGPPLCHICGIPFIGAGADHLCGNCHKHPPPYDAARAAFIYDGHCRTLIHSFKYNNKIHLRRPLALLTGQRLQAFITARAPDIIIPVPLHVKRLRSRGFNQSVLLGELLAQVWRLPLERQALKRIRWTEPQINLSADKRLDNVKGAFAVSDRFTVAGKRVLLVDDVMTTGSTAKECAAVLKQAGAVDVSVITVARAVSC